MQINEETTTGSNDNYDVATQNEKILYWPIICKLNSKDFVKVYATWNHAASVKPRSHTGILMWPHTTTHVNLNVIKVFIYIYIYIYIYTHRFLNYIGLIQSVQLKSGPILI